MTALKIAAVYAVAGALWILCSGWLLHHFVRDAAHAETLENVKGWFFVGVTATVLGVWLDRMFRRIRGATALLRQSEARFATIFKDSPMAEVITRLRDGVILDANESFSQLCRYPREELVGHTAAELRLWHSGNREVVLEDLRERGRVAAEMQGRDRNGETGDVLATFQLIELDGEPCVLGSLQDITERKRAERALRDNEERLRFSLESCHIGAWDLDLADDTAFCSMEHARIFGYERPRSDWSRGEFLRHIVPDDRTRVQDTIQRAVDTSGDFSFECRILRADGEPRWIWVAGRPTAGADGRSRRMAGIVQDVTGRKLAEAARQESEEMLRLFIEHAPAALAMFDRDMHYLVVSQRWISDYGLEVRDIKGRSHYDIFPEIGEPLKQIHRRGLAGESMCSDDDRFQRADGTVTHLRWEMHPWRDGGGGVGGIVIFTEDITKRKLAEAAVRESDERFRSLLEGAPEAVYVQCEGVFRYVNQAGVRRLGAARVEDLLGRPFPDRIAPEYHHCIPDRIRSQRENGIVAPAMEQEYLRLDGTRVPVETSAVAIRFQNQDGHLVFVRDIRARREAEAERKNLEAQLRQAQKLESIGLLAGGVAHDFNNLLMGILGCAELARDEIAADDPIRCWLDEITVGARRSAAITRQLLAFARKQPISPVVLDLNDHLTGMLKLLRRLIREDIELTWRPSAREAWIRMDMSQIDQIMANLVVNSRDAIVGVGSLIIETRHVVLDAERCAGHAGVVPGDYVVLAVSDSGCGMDRATRERIFEPFFTTKDPGKGTGLGLSTVYGIVQQNQGFLEVDSEPGKGTTFRIYIPGLAPEEANRDVPSAAVEATRGSETVLLVEDEKSVRLTTGMFLQGLGYTVLSAADPEEALRQVEDYPGTIHLLITDVVMPGMSGRDLNTKLAEVFPEISCLYVSGYTADIIANQGVPNEGMHFLAKPFTRKELARKARDVLRDRGSRSPARNRDRDVQNP